MSKSQARKLNNYHPEFKDLIDAHLPLVVARNLATTRATLKAEYPHAATSIDLLLRSLREGEAVRIAPVLLVGPLAAESSVWWPSSWGCPFTAMMARLLRTTFSEVLQRAGAIRCRQRQSALSTRRGLAILF